MIVVWIAIFVCSLAVLIYSSDAFIERAERVGLSLGISKYVVGVLIVALGTSLPELITSVFAIMGDDSSPLTYLPIDLIIGSNVANVLIVLGLSALVAKKIRVSNKLIESDIPLLTVFTSAFVFFLYGDQMLSRSESVFCLLLFLVFLAYTFKTRSIHEWIKTKTPRASGVDVGILLLSLGGIFVGAHLLVTSLENFIFSLGLQSIALFSILLLGLSTSLPEVAVSLQAARKKKFELIIGNIFGSNVFNMLLVGGVAGFLSPLGVGSEVLAIGVPFLIISTIVMIVVAQDDHIGYWEGIGLLSLYILFASSLIGIVA